MITCTVHERFEEGKAVEARADAIRFVKEGIAWWALPFPALWLLYHRLWIAFVVYLAIVLCIAATFSAPGVSETVGGMITFTMSFLLALEGNDLRRWTLSRKGYQLIDVTSGRNIAECEQRFFDDWLPAQGRRQRKAADTPKPTDAPTGPPASGGDDVIGLFPEPGR